MSAFVGGGPARAEGGEHHQRLGEGSCLCNLSLASPENAGTTGEPRLPQVGIQSFLLKLKVIIVSPNKPVCALACQIKL